MSDETHKLLSETVFVWRSPLPACRPATAPLPKTLSATLAKVLANPTMGYISNALSYSRVVRGKQERKNLVRLLKGGFLRAVLVEGPAPLECADRVGSVGVDRRHYRLELVAGVPA